MIDRESRSAAWRPVSVAAALSGGLAIYAATLAATALIRIPGPIGTITSVGIEEILKLAAFPAAIALARGIGATAKSSYPLAFLAILAFSGIETASYVRTFPDSGAYARLLSANAVHAAGGLLVWGCLGARRGKRAASLAAASVLQLSWHSFYNLLLASLPTPIAVGAAMAWLAASAAFAAAAMAEGAIHDGT